MRMNKKGQTLVLFVILIPVFIVFCAFVIDNGILLNKKSHVEEVTKTIMENNKDKLFDEELEEIIKKAYLENKIDSKNLKIAKENNQIVIENELLEERIFGSIIGLKDAKIKIKVIVIVENNKIRFE